MFFPLVSMTLASFDLIMKQIIETQVQEGEKRDITGTKIELRNVHNHGLMLNLLEQKPEVVKTLSRGAFLSLLAFVIRAWRQGNIMAKFGASLVLGGATSNMYDRIRRGYVVDYIGFKGKQKKLSNITYNVGDFGIFLGLLLQIFSGKRK